jgi:hypothetical protein
MKLLVVIFFLSSLAVAAPTGKNRILPVTKEDEAVQRDKLAREKIKALETKDDEDCDEKAKKNIEIIPEALSLSDNAGCTLPE